MTTSLIISTYNRPDALEVCLESVRRLTTLPDEVIVGDDGSRPDTRAVVERFQANFPVSLHYVWQEDHGFRLAMLRNRCIARATGDYIIQIDGDIMLHPQFVADHLRNARPGCFLKGGRVRLSESLTREICRARLPRPISLLTNGIEGKRANALRLPALGRWLASRYRRNRDNVLGCNMSFFRNDLLAVNGYDETYEGWGAEDLDLAYRLRNLGVAKRYLKFCALAYHLWHREAPLDKTKSNHARARAAYAAGQTRATRGLDTHIH